MLTIRKRGLYQDQMNLCPAKQAEEVCQHTCKTFSSSGVGYSGYQGAANDPCQQGKKNVGPIPQGWWTIGWPYNSPLGTPTFALTPFAEEQLLGRDNLFRIHAINAEEDAEVRYSSSTGCIIMT